MGETDNPLKLLIAQFSQAFADWLLGVEVRVIRPLNVEFPASPSRSDLLFEVIEGLSGITWQWRYWPVSRSHHVRSEGYNRLPVPIPLTIWQGCLLYRVWAITNLNI